MHDSQLPCWGLWYYAHVAAGSSWKCRGTHLRLMIQNSMGSPGEPPGIVLSATTSVSMPISPQSLFDFLQNEQLRSEWDELSHGGLMQEMVHIPKGQDCANCISLLRPSDMTKQKGKEQMEVCKARPLKIILPSQKMRMKQTARKRTIEPSPTTLEQKKDSSPPEKQTTPMKPSAENVRSPRKTIIEPSPTNLEQKKDSSPPQKQTTPTKSPRRKPSAENVRSPRKRTIEPSPTNLEQKKASSPPQKQTTPIKPSAENVRSPRKRTRSNTEHMDEQHPTKRTRSATQDVRSPQKKKQTKTRIVLEEGKQEDKEREDEEDDDAEEQQQKQKINKRTKAAHPKSRSQTQKSKKKRGQKKKRPEQDEQDEEVEEDEVEEEEEEEGSEEEQGTEEQEEEWVPEEGRPTKEEESSSSSSEEDEDEDDDEDDDEDEKDQKELQKKTARSKSRKPIENKGQKKKTRTKKNAKKEKKAVKKEVEKFQYRSSMVSFAKLLKDIKFTETQKREIQKSPFSTLILAVADAQWDDSYFKKSDHDALKLVEQYEGQRGRFKLGAKLVKITAREFSLIFGIKSGPNRIELSKKPRMPEIPFAYEISVKRIMTNISLREFFNTKVMAGENEQDAKDVARVLTLYLISTVFLPSTASRISWSFFPFIEDLEKCSSYAWSTFFTEELIKQLNTNCTTPTVAGGCIVGLLYWLCEHTTLIQEAKPDNMPRFMKWRLSDLTEALVTYPLCSLDPEKVVESELGPNDEEQEFVGLADGDEEEKDTNEVTKTEDAAHNREQNRIKILEDEIKRLREENEQKEKTICELKKRILELEHETIPDLSFEVETSHFERNFMANEVKDKEVEICGILVENEIIADKLEMAEENLDDMAAHCLTQQVKEGKEVKLPDEQRKEQDKEVFTNEGATLFEEMVPDVEVDKTINETVHDILHDQGKPKKKTGKTPSSMTNRVKGVYSRVEKRDSSYIYPEDEKKKKDTEMWKAENTKLGRFLSEKDMNLLKRFHQLYQGHEIHNEPIWQNNKTEETVTLKSIIKLLQEGDMGNEVIDGYTDTLKTQQEQKGQDRGNVAYITSTCWTLITSANESLKRHFHRKIAELQEEAQQKGNDYYRLIVFPINSFGKKTSKNTSPYHWTVVIYDVEAEEWRHYNSFRSRRKVDPYLQDAITVKNCVEQFMKELELKKNDLPQFELLSQARPIFKIGAPIKSVDETPQQNESSVDCGIFVCYIIKRLAEKREIPQTLQPRDVAEFRVHMVHKFLNDDQRTWTEDLWKDNQMANKMEQ